MHNHYPIYDLNWRNFSNHSSVFHNSLFLYQLLVSSLRSFLSREIILSLALILLFSFSSQALVAHTFNTINGTAPYLTFDNGQTKVTSLNDEFFKITLSNGREITPVTNSSSTIPIVLPNLGETLADINMVVPIGTNSVKLSSLIGAPYNYWKDDDGDDDFSISGDLNLIITDKNNQVVPRNTRLEICNAPYKVTLSNTDAILKTRYGVPDGTNINTRSVTYYINPKASPSLCFVRPNLVNDQSVKDHNFNGPANMWNPAKGYIPQATYDLNFPTTGANELHFYLDIGGVQQLKWQEVKRGGITVKAGYDVDSHGEIVNATMVRVTLKGPSATPEQWKADEPGRVDKPDLPQTFELVGRYDDNGPAIVKYGFVLKQWFVNRGNIKTNNEKMANWCRKIDYRLPQVKDLTNSVCRGAGSFEFCKGVEGAHPESDDNYFTRAIGAGFFSEWGNLSYNQFYGTEVNFYEYGYWTRDIGTETNPDPTKPAFFDVYTLNGLVGWDYPRRYDGAYGVCVVYPLSLQLGRI